HVDHVVAVLLRLLPEVVLHEGRAGDALVVGPAESRLPTLGTDLPAAAAGPLAPAVAAEVRRASVATVPGERRDRCQQDAGGNETNAGTTPAASPQGARTMLTAPVPSAPERALSHVARRPVVCCHASLRSIRSAA